MLILRYLANLVKRIADAAGYQLVVTKRERKNAAHPYEQVLPIANYSPWLTDQEFIKTYEIIRDYTKVDKYRCYELWQLIGEAAKLEGAMIEIGVWRGGSAALIAEQARMSGIKDNFYLCDTFIGVVKAGKNDETYKGGEHADTSKTTVESLISRFKFGNTSILTGIFPEGTAHLVADKKFRFCHIDVDVYQSAKDVVEWIWPKLVVGGIIVFDDYGFQGCVGITRFIDEERKRQDRLVIHNLNGHAILVKIKEAL